MVVVLWSHSVGGAGSVFADAMEQDVTAGLAKQNVVILTWAALFPTASSASSKNGHLAVYHICTKNVVVQVTNSVMLQIPLIITTVITCFCYYS